METAIYNPHQISEIQTTGRIPEDLLPKTKEQTYSVLAKWPKEYFRSIVPANYNEVFNSILPSVASCRKEMGLMPIRAILVIILTDMAKQYNTGQNMDDNQTANLADDILEMFYWLKIDDFKLCFNNAKRGRYGNIFRVDGPLVLSWLDQYTTDRLHAADETSYQEHQSTKGDKALFNFNSEIDVYEHFKKKL